MRKVILLEAVIIVLLVTKLVWKEPAKVIPRPLDQYTFTNLRQKTFLPTEIVYEKKTAQDPKFSTWIFHYYSDGKRVSGLANLPTGVFASSILMLHGSTDSVAEYFPGFGTQPVAAVLARNGFATFAPDLLGYATSDKSSDDPFEDRFQTYTTTLTLLATLSQGSAKVGIWGHSNGGQIALSDLEISGANIPTALWNPVSEGFPYNILYFTNGYSDKGKWLRAALAKFEALYDVENYSTPNFVSWITAPLLLQQATADEWVPRRWNDDFVNKFKSLKVQYKVYPGANHNMVPQWNQATADTLKFFQNTL